MILHIYSDSSCISEPYACSRAGIYLFFGPKSINNTPITEIPQENGTVHVECIIMRNFMESDDEAELGGLFENDQKATYIWTAIEEMVHPQQPTSVATDNIAKNSIVNGTAKKSRAIDMRFYWVRDRIRKTHFYVFWEEGGKNLADYLTKHHLI